MADDDTQSRFATLEAEGRHTRQVVTDMSADLRSLLALVTEIRLSQATMLGQHTATRDGGARILSYFAIILSLAQAMFMAVQTLFVSGHKG